MINRYFNTAAIRADLVAARDRVKSVDLPRSETLSGLRADAAGAKRSLGRGLAALAKRLDK